MKAFYLSFPLHSCCFCFYGCLHICKNIHFYIRWYNNSVDVISHELLLNDGFISSTWNPKASLKFKILKNILQFHHIVVQNVPYNPFADLYFINLCKVFVMRRLNRKQVKLGRREKQSTIKQVVLHLNKFIKGKLSRWMVEMDKKIIE